MLLTLIGPLDFLGDDYMFSAHMLEHILLELAVPPLLLLGIPASAVRSLLSVNNSSNSRKVPPQTHRCLVAGSADSLAVASADAL